MKLEDEIKQILLPYKYLNKREREEITTKIKKLFDKHVAEEGYQKPF